MAFAKRETFVARERFDSEKRERIGAKFRFLAI